MKYYYFVDTDGEIIRINHKRKPTEKSIPKMGTWIVYEFHRDYKGKWCMACFPEITWPTLSRMKYIGSIPVEAIK